MSQPSTSRWIVVIPARLSSTRLQEKPLQDLAGKPLIMRVYENLKPLAAKGIPLIVATDSDKISQALKKLDSKIQVVMTRADHPSGTDRCWEVASAMKCDFVLNVQGDEPFISVGDLEKLMSALENTKSAALATLMYRSKRYDDFKNPNVVKVVVTQNNEALYFTRAEAPFPRELKPKEFYFWQHLGVYAYRREALARFCELKPSPLELSEKLEQLRALENGMKITLQEASAMTLGIDTPEDLEEARERFKT